MDETNLHIIKNIGDGIMPEYPHAFIQSILPLGVSADKYSMPYWNSLLNLEQHPYKWLMYMVNFITIEFER